MISPCKTCPKLDQNKDLCSIDCAKIKAFQLHLNTAKPGLESKHVTSHTICLSSRGGDRE